MGKCLSDNQVEKFHKDGFLSPINVFSINEALDLKDKLEDADLRFALKDNKNKLKYRLRDLFKNFIEAGEKPFLFLFDDFEWNFQVWQNSDT